MWSEVQLEISKLDWRDGGGKKGREGERKGRRTEGILLCNDLIITLVNEELEQQLNEAK